MPRRPLTSFLGYIDEARAGITRRMGTAGPPTELLRFRLGVLSSINILKVQEHLFNRGVAVAAGVSKSLGMS